MNTYGRNGKIGANESHLQEVPPVAQEETTEKEKGIKVDGFRQVVEMLEIADEEFRQSLLSRIQKADPDLAFRIRKELGI